METITYDQLKKFCRPYTALQLAMNATWWEEVNLISEDRRYVTNGAILLSNPKDSLLKRNIRADEVLIKRVEAIFKMYPNRRPAKPTKLFDAGKLHERIDIKVVRFQTEDCQDCCYFDASYVRLLWDACSNCAFQIDVDYGTLFVHTPEGEFVGSLMKINTKGLL